MDKNTLLYVILGLLVVLVIVSLSSSNLYVEGFKEKKANKKVDKK